MADTPWRIGESTTPSSAYCECGHPMAAHGTNGYICCRCDCKQFSPYEKQTYQNQTGGWLE